MTYSQRWPLPPWNSSTMLGLPPSVAEVFSEFPGPFNSQFGLPPLHCLSVVTANAGAAVATIIMAATRATTINKPMRLIKLHPFPTHLPNGVSLKPCQVGCGLRGLGVLCVPLPLATNKRPAPCPYTSTSLVLSSPHPLLPLLAWHFSKKQNRLPSGLYRP